MKVEIVPCLMDNYAYVLLHEAGGEAIVVDPSEARPVLETLARLRARPVAALCTHHHNDHIGGLAELTERYPAMRVLGHAVDRQRVAWLTDSAAHHELLQLGAFSALALHVPGHTQGAIAWIVEGCAFTGDTLFVAGCGKLLEGTAAQMFTSLNEVLGALHDSTMIYCGHEYTTSNLRFALRMEPGNSLASQKLEDALIRRFGGDPTVPSTMSEERKTNPFLRCNAGPICETARRDGCRAMDPLSVFTWLRERKDRFRPSEVGRR
jgi:hydroxyacylglutathione hydrolase